MSRVAVVLVVAACGPRAEPSIDPTTSSTVAHEHQPGPVPVTGSTTLVAHGALLYGVNAWDGTVVRTDTISATSEEQVLDGEPTRLALVGDELWVSLRSAGAVAILDDLDEVERLAVGAEPYGIVASADGTRTYVALSQADEIVEIDVVTREPTRRWAVGDDPRWLAIHPTGRTLYVGYGSGSVFTEIGLDSDEVVDHELALAWRPDDPEVALSGRVTGDPSVGPRGDRLLLPLLYADNQSPEPDLPFDTTRVARINPAVAAVGLGPDDGSVDEIFLPSLVAGTDLSGVVRGVVSQVTYAEEDQGLALATLSPSDAVALLDIAHSAFEPPGGGFFSATFAAIEVADDPSAIAWTDSGEAWVQEQGERTVARLPLEEILEVYDPLRADTFHAEGRLQAGASRLEPLVEEGRRLFHSGGDESCSTCHPEGRSDGLTWLVDGQAVQTPSLEGVATTSPYLHDGRLETLREVLEWYGGFSNPEMDALEAWLRAL